MRNSHPFRASTWSTTWFSTFWRQQISTAATATSAAILDRVLRADKAAAFEGPESCNPHSRFPRHNYYNQNHERQHPQYRCRSQELRQDLTYTRNARISTSPRSTGFCVIWDCISSSSSSLGSDSGYTGVWGTNRNKGARPPVWWSSGNEIAGSHHHHQGLGFHISQGSGARS